MQWDELIDVLEQVETIVGSWEQKAPSQEEIDRSLQAMQVFNMSAAALEASETVQAGTVVENYLRRHLSPDADAEKLTVLTFAVSSLLQAVRRGKEAGGEVSWDLAEIMDILDGSVLEDASVADREGFPAEESSLRDREAETDAAQEEEAHRLRAMIEGLGGEMRPADDDVPEAYRVSFDALTPQQIKAMVFSLDPEAGPSSLFPQKNEGLEEVLINIKEFMFALAQGDMNRSEQILAVLAEHRSQAAIYEEIGVIARDLHESLKNFMDTIDQGLKEMIEDRLPDSGNRLEHILELTEKAATTTLNHVEAMQSRNREEQENLTRLRGLLQRLSAIGDQARRCLRESGSLLDSLDASLRQNHDDLITVLTAQDYQDLTGQIILKILRILKDLEYRLVNLIRTFGGEAQSARAPSAERNELYGPAHSGKEGTLQSQDDVDDLLAELGL
jgi:chemotaxis protein CheZ